VQTVEDGNDVAAIEQALQRARDETTRPSLVRVRTHIGYGSPKQDSYKAHGSPLGEQDVAATKRKLGWPEQPTFLLPDDAMAHFRTALDRGKRGEEAWRQQVDAHAEAFADEARELRTSLEAKLPDGWDADIPAFPADAKGMATREAGGKVLSAIAPRLPALTGGSADLDPSTYTAVQGLGDFDPRATPGDDEQGSAGGGWRYSGRNLHFGVREHAMGAICNGMAAHGGTRVYGGTFLVFSDYMRPAVRLAALMQLPVTYVWTHDSIGLGEDGPTHQPVEHLAALRAIPGLDVVRPADANESVAAWKKVLETTDRPAGLALTRQNVPTFPRGTDGFAGTEGVARGGYVLVDAEKGVPAVILVGTGSEVQLAVRARALLAEKGVDARVVSMPCREWFDAQDQAYRDAVLPPIVKARVSVEAGVAQGWREVVGDHGRIVSLEHFGGSADFATLFAEFGITAEAVVLAAEDSIRAAGV
jgi:transketolase